MLHAPVTALFLVTKGFLDCLLVPVVADLPLRALSHQLLSARYECWQGLD